MGYIKKRDGFLGLYAGLVPKVLEMPVTYYTSKTFNKVLRLCHLALHSTNTVLSIFQHWPDRPEDCDAIGKHEITDPAEQARIWRVVSRGVMHRMCVAVATQPLQVIVVRCMAQFIGKEDKYNGALSAIKEIFEQNGLFGFWSGLLPRALGEISLVCITTALLHFLNRFFINIYSKIAVISYNNTFFDTDRYVFTDKEYQQFTAHIGSFLATSLVYPFTVVSKCMIVSSSGLAAGYPPHMPFYRNWLDCYNHLKSQNALKRGASLFFRYLILNSNLKLDFPKYFHY